MCVIICIEDGKYPSKSTLEDAESLNVDGGSIAWLNHDGTKSYQKGIDAKKIHTIIEKELQPNGIKTAIIHFRIASVGDVDKKLCHPFEITRKVDLNLGGRKLREDLLFHNGTWSEYAEVMLEYLGTQDKPMSVPFGKYSDSRVMAYLAYRIGHKRMSKLVMGWNKIAILTSKGIIKYGSGWCNVKGNQCSNDYFVESGKPWYGHYYYGKQGLQVISDKETEEIKELQKKYDVTQAEIEDYLDYGYGIKDVEYLLEEEQERYDRMIRADEAIIPRDRYGVVDDTHP